VKHALVVAASSALALFVASSLLVTGTATAQPPARPKLIVAIAVDQFSSDLFNQFRPTFTGGLKRLSGGVVFPAGYQGHAATETCPGHSTILTGSRPSRTGIIANDWQNPKVERKDKAGKLTFDVYCAEAPGPAGSNAADAPRSSAFLRVPTLGDRMKAAQPKTRVVSVSGKDRAAIMLGGHNADLTLWWNGTAFGSYAGKDILIPSQLSAINARATAAIAKPVIQMLPKGCAASSRAVSLSSTKTIGTLQTRQAGDERAWRATPQFDAMTLDVALAALDALKLGKGETTDLLAIGLSATDYVGHGFGTSGAEMCTQIAALDATLDRLLIALDQSKIDYVVTLTADHGGHDVPERNDLQGLPAAVRADAALSAKTMGAKLAAQFGMDGNVLIGRANFGDMYLASSIPAAKRGAVLDAAVSLYRNHPQVAAVFTHDQLAASPAPKDGVEDWTLLERARASFDAERSGDFLVLLNRYVTPIPDTNQGYYATHGSPWGYDRRVPILFWWKGAAPFEQPNGVETADIMPTLASLISLTVPPSEIDGRCLDLVAGAESNCK
jgi:predicted AlkP superfamily pyrophosphatase or phosphodiesterase